MSEETTEGSTEGSTGESTGNGTEGWNRRVFLRGTVTTAGVAGVTALTGRGAVAAAGSGTGDGPAKTGTTGTGLRVVRTGVEYTENLLGTDVERPRLSWELAAPGHGARQTAYHVRVTRDSGGRGPRTRTVWDSGKVASDRSVGIPYGGPALLPRTRYHWQVRVWDAAGRRSRWSETRWWETSLPADGWRARWIGAEEPPAPPSLEGASWIWSPGATASDAPEGERRFRATLTLPAGSVVKRAVVSATADDDFTLYVGGQQVLHAPLQTDGWRTGRTADVTEQARSADGAILVAALATNRPGASVNPGGFLARLLVETEDGRTRELRTGDGWRTSGTAQEGWERPGFDDGDWEPAAVLAPYGQGPWGGNVTVTGPEAPAPLLRRSFTVHGRVARARLHISGLAYYEAEINGRRVGDQVLDPGFTDYDETVLYAVHDVTELLRSGENAIGVAVGRGFYGMTTPNVWNWHRAPWHGEPRLLAQLEIDHPDGTRTTVATDGDWRITEGPTLSNSLYAGETYDARRAPEGWSRAGFDDSGWRSAGVRGAAEGTVVRLVHGEKLEDDGSVHAETGHVPGRFQTDEYVCAGRDEEVWEPSFSYKGFRYVEVHGLPARPAPEDVLGRLVHSRVDEVSSFSCSEPFYEWLDRAMRRTVLNNLHGIPTDTPMYEKNGWTGDAQLGTPVMTYAFGMQRFLSKWLGDLADSQNDDGQLPVIVPSGGWGYGDLGPSPEWTTVYPFVVRELYRVYGDERAAREHWETLTRYLDWELGRLRDGLAVTALGDYLAPGYGGNPPEDTRLTATAYLYRALLHTAELGEALTGLPGDNDVPGRYRAAAEELRKAFNEAFLGPDGHYRTAKDPDYRQTSNAIPLAFGLVPPGARATVLESLVADIEERGNHLNTGALGTSVLLRVLCAHGRPDVAHAVATRRTYPGWGYWHDNGADTMWEMWPLDSRSRDHYFQGTVAQWLYENVAGLRPGDAGWRTFTVRPDARTGVEWARTSIRTVRGEAAVAWSAVDGRLRLTVRVPVGSRAEVHVPVSEGGRATVPRGAEFVRSVPGFDILRAGHGSWEFTGDA
ncbi:family 78 glycoside hydrolase catalytic domain [Streptomyces sp. ISBFB 2968]|uniref:family 78 glycoside hydrolase catalytic domain n=1 Tax=Streptomyces sp. ISBFB 2968 TaxID=2903527 RepID=UPI002FDC49C1